MGDRVRAFGRKVEKPGSAKGCDRYAVAKTDRTGTLLVFPTSLLSAFFVSEQAAG
jgi:hypothetical protein